MADVTFERVSCRYSGADGFALTDLNLDIADGELFVICGATESGKSTVLRLLAGLVPLNEGRILVGGREIGEGEHPEVGMVFQNYSIYPNLTVSDNIGLPLRKEGLPKATISERVAEVATMLDLGDLLGRQGGVLTAGQRIRVALARGLVRQPAVLLMDEPLANLEAGIHAEVAELLATAQRRHGVTTLYATADPDEALGLGQRVALLENGKLQEVVVPAELDVASPGQRAARPL